MVKSLFVVVDGSPAGICAEDTAIEIAQQHGARIEALSAIDRPWVTVPVGSMRGAAFMKSYLRRQNALARAVSVGESLVEGYGERCRAAGVAFSEAETQEQEDNLFFVESEPHDIIVMGKYTDYHFDPDADFSNMVLELAQNDPRPVIITTPTKPTATRVLAAYDGSLPASRAFHMFALLGLGEGKIVEVVSIHRDQGTADALAARGAQIFHTHGISTEIRGVKFSHHPGDALVDMAQDAGMLLMGAFGENTLREYFFGSVSKRILANSPTTIFLHQ